jgi:hypothetical protein
MLPVLSTNHKAKFILAVLDTFIKYTSNLQYASRDKSETIDKVNVIGFPGVSGKISLENFCKGFTGLSEFLTKDRKVNYSLIDNVLSIEII